MIEVEKLSKYYGTRKAIDNISFSVGKGEILGFLGPNGAGKTTTMKILTCFMPASSGVARVAGFDVFEESLEVKKRVGYLPETPPVYREMIVWDFLEYKASLHGIRGDKAKSAIDDAIAKCGLGDVRKRLIGNLSKGYRQRVGLAQAIVHDPEVLILDEPTIGLDPKQILEIRTLIKSLAGSRTVILSTHILPEVQATCSRVLIINDGKIVAIDRIDKITSQLKEGNVVLVTVKGQSSQLIDRLKGLPNVISVRESTVADGLKFTVTTNNGVDVQGRIAEAVLQSGAELVELKRESLSLEDVFLKLTTVETERSLS